LVALFNTDQAPLRRLSVCVNSINRQSS